MTAETLRTYTLKDLARMAKKRGVNGWHAMRKDQLVRALVRRVAPASTAKKSTRKPVLLKRIVKAPQRVVRATHATANGSPKSNVAPKSNGAPKANVVLKSNGAPKANGAPRANGVLKSNGAPKAKHPAVVKRLADARARSDRMKNLASFRSPKAPNGYTKDRLVVMVRDAYWLHANWELTRQGVERAQAAMGQEWHVARPVLRLMEVSSSGTTSSTERLMRSIEIHGGVNNWYVDVSDPPHSYRMDIGYMAPSGKFFMLAKSNIVRTPHAGASDSIDENWSHVAENFDKIYYMSGGYAENGAGELQELFEERLRRPMGSPMTTRFSSVLNGLRKKHSFSFELDAELLVYGTTEPTARVTLHGDPVKVRPDGTFTVRFSLPNCRQVIPAVACSADGLEQRTIVLAVERNTKEMEPLVRDGND